MDTHTFFHQLLAGRARLRIQEAHRPKTNDHEHSIPQLGCSRTTHDIRLRVNHIIRTAPPHPILANGDQFPAAKEEGHMGIDAVVLRRIATALAVHVDINMAIYPCGKFGIDDLCLGLICRGHDTGALW